MPEPNGCSGGCWRPCAGKGWRLPQIILISAFVPRTGHLAEALAQVRPLEPGKWLERLDETIEKAAREDARETLAAVWSAWAEGEKESGTLCHRSESLVSCMGRVAVRYPYAPRKGVGKRVVAKLGGIVGPK